MARVITASALTCPHCSLTWQEVMPERSCQISYRCEGCGAELRPLPGDCCVYCSYGSVPCPPIQRELHSSSTAVGY